MEFSFIIPTYNRYEELKELVPSIDGLKYDKDAFELIIVDDGSIDETSSYIETIQQEFTFEIRYYKQENIGPGPARNRGMSEAKGDYFIFVDSDCILPSDYLSKIYAALKLNKYDAFGGPDTYHPSFPPLLKAIDYSMTSFIGTGGTRGSKTSIAKYYPRSFNMGIKKEVYHNIGGFRKMRHGQDMDFSARIYNKKYHVGLIHEAYVYHKRRTSFWKFFKQIHNWGLTRINLSLEHSGMLKPIHLVPAFLVFSTTIIFILWGFFPSVLPLILLSIISLGLISIFAFLQSLSRYRSLPVAILSIATLLIQVLAYGVGSLNGIWQIVILRKSRAEGITKNYYK